MDRIGFEALEHRSDGSFAPARFRFEGDPATGWQVLRNERAHLSLGPGYGCLASRACGVCATDLARRFLPFPLPQVIGHELLAETAAGERRVVEINASCRARGLPPCATCAAGLERHCPARLVLGIHDLPGGFAPFVLAPLRAALPVPPGLPDETAALVEPFAAALHAARTLDLRPGDRVAVLGPRRLGMLLIAALAAERRRIGASWELVALARRPELLALARELGADELRQLPVGGPPAERFDVVVDTTGTPDGLTVALAAARRELHLKSTHGQPAGGLRHVTELVVDELRIEPLGAGIAGRVAWLSEAAPDRASSGAAELLRGAAAGREAGRPDGAPGLDAAVVSDGPGADAAIRPDPGRQRGLVRPRGVLWVHPDASACAAPLLREVARRGLRITTSRCGDFRAALDLLASDPALAELGPRLVSHRFAPDQLALAFRAATSREAVKVLVEHPRR